MQGLIISFSLYQQIIRLTSSQPHSFSSVSLNFPSLFLPLVLVLVLAFATPYKPRPQVLEGLLTVTQVSTQTLSLNVAVPDIFVLFFIL